MDTNARPLSSSLSLKNKMLKILKDTKEYYSKDPANRRSITDDGDCMYTWGDNHCAVGRYLDPDNQCETWDYNNDSIIDICEAGDDYGIDWVLREDVQGLDAGFWKDLQNFHDLACHWVEWSKDEDGVRFNGLTDSGKEEYVKIEDKILDDFYELNLEGE